jgi:hypothetical protein
VSKSSHVRIRQITYKKELINQKLFEEQMLLLIESLNDKIAKNHSKAGEKILKNHLAKLL